MFYVCDRTGALHIYKDMFTTAITKNKKPMESQITIKQYYCVKMKRNQH